MRIQLSFALLGVYSLFQFNESYGFSPSTQTGGFVTKRNTHHSSLCTSLFNQGDDWNGEVVSNTPDGKIRGCQITQVDGSQTEWIISIDGQDADLGKFSEAIYRKITSDAKRERFQGFRPGTIPPHLISAYIGFSMDECARESTLEAMQQNNIRPFEDARNEIEFDTISFIPPKPKKKKKKKKKKGAAAAQTVAAAEPEEPQALTFDTLKEACNAGWKPGQSFSFVARNIKGQKVLDQDAAGANPLGGGSSSII